MPEHKDWREECGVVGILGAQQSPEGSRCNETARLLYLGLYALQHRGQEACGLYTLETNRSGKACPHIYHSLGKVAERIQESDLAKLKGGSGLGHVRYSTQGDSSLANVQPFARVLAAQGPIALAHNGNITNAQQLKHQLSNQGHRFLATSDSELFVHLLAQSSKPSLAERLFECMRRVHGAYALVVLAQDHLFGIRDPYGFRPLVLGAKAGAWILASETCALDLMGAEFIREVEPGEVVHLEKHQLHSYFPLPRPEKQAFCAFEAIYFSRPDSQIQGHSVYELRKRMGAVLAREAPVAADLVTAIPDSGVAMAIGYAQAAGLPLELGLVRNHYVGRTFIEPEQAKRDFGVKLKLNPIVSTLKDKRVVVLDDSVVRGTTCKRIIRMLREAGTKEIHFRVASPPITHSCFYGVSTPERENLIAAQKTLKEICHMLEADTMAYLSVAGLQEALGSNSAAGNCFACFNGQYREKIFQKIPLQRTDRLSFHSGESL